MHTIKQLDRTRAYIWLIMYTPCVFYSRMYRNNSWRKLQNVIIIFVSAVFFKLSRHFKFDAYLVIWNCARLTYNNTLDLLKLNIINFSRHCLDTHRYRMFFDAQYINVSPFYLCHLKFAYTSLNSSLLPRLSSHDENNVT